MNATPVKIALLAGLVCTNSEEKIASYDAEKFIGKLVNFGHESVIEHLNYNFFIEDVSRAVLQEISRHRHVSLSVKSSRWALNKFISNMKKYVPRFDKYKLTEEHNQILSELDFLSFEIDKLMQEASQKGIPNDVLKYYIQESITTSMMFTVNARELLHIFNLRTKPNVLFEFRELCKKLYDSLPEEHKFIYKRELEHINSI